MNTIDVGGGAIKSYVPPFRRDGHQPLPVNKRSAGGWNAGGPSNNGGGGGGRGDGGGGSHYSIVDLEALVRDSIIRHDDRLDVIKNEQDQALAIVLENQDLLLKNLALVLKNQELLLTPALQTTVARVHENSPEISNGIPDYAKALKKKRKADLVEICNENSVDSSGTIKDMISRLLKKRARVDDDGYVG